MNSPKTLLALVSPLFYGSADKHQLEQPFNLSKSVANLTNYLPKYRNVLAPFEFGGKIKIPTCMHKRAKTDS